MSIEELGRIADAARDWIYSDWDFYEYVKHNHSDATGNWKHFLKIGRLVEECYGPKPANWTPNET